MPTIHNRTRKYMTFLTLKVTTNKQNEERKAAQHRTEEQDAFSHFSKTFLDFPCPTKVGRTDYKNNNTKKCQNCIPKIHRRSSIFSLHFQVFIQLTLDLHRRVFIEFSYLMIKWISAEFHRARNDSFGGHCVENLLIFENNQPSHVSDNGSQLEVFEVLYLYIG